MTINNLFIYFFPFVSFNSTADSSYHSRKRFMLLIVANVQVKVKLFI
ncbi:hypothetical protein HanPI659440_Chr00c04g0711831 [Helianthus annuus]|nr:hypothetical protein HanPI659440_Chr00c04g0711831 [Helianthus annuus]